MNPLNFLLKYLHAFEEGRVLLSTGDYAWKIVTKSTPNLVWIAETDSGNAPVCGGGVNFYNVTKLDDGFVLHAQINTDKAELLWQAYMGPSE